MREETEGQIMVDSVSLLPRRLIVRAKVSSAKHGSLAN